MSSEAQIIDAVAAALPTASRYECRVELQIKSRWSKCVDIKITPQGATVQIGDQPTEMIEAPQ